MIKIFTVMEFQAMKLLLLAGLTVNIDRFSDVSTQSCQGTTLGTLVPFRSEKLTVIVQRTLLGDTIMLIA